MPRQSRAVSSTGIYHVMMRGIDRQNIYRDKYDRQKFLQCLNNSLTRFRPTDGEYEVYAYALMGNHFHLLVRVVSGSLGTLMKKLASGYVVYFNRKYHRDGHLFKERFKSEICEDDEYFLTLLRYIHQNPIKAYRCKDLLQYQYTSWGEYKDPDNSTAKICKCDYVLQRVSVDELEEMIYDILPANTKCIDIYKSRGRVHDRSIIKRLRAVHDMDVEALKSIRPKERRVVYRDLLAYGGSISQLNRLLGVSKSVLSRIGG